MLIPALSLALLYAVTGRLGLTYAHVHENATLVWAPSGLALAAVWLFGQRMWPGVAIGAFVVNLSLGTPVATSLGIASGNTLEAVVGAWALRSWTGFDGRLARVRDVVAFIVIGVFGCTTVAATAGVASLWASGLTAGQDVAQIWLTWWLGDAGGVLILTPFLLLAWSGAPPWRDLVRSREWWAVTLGVAISSWLAWGEALGAAWSYVVSFVPFPFMVWAGMRLGPRGAMTSVLAAAVVAVGAMRGGHHLVQNAPIQHQQLLLWAYCLILGTVGLLLAAAVAERTHAEEARLAERERRLAEEVAHRKLEAKVATTERLRNLGLLAGGVAHDFNNILVPIRGNASLLGLRAGLGEDERRMVRRIEVASVRAAELCQRLLAFAGEAHPKAEAVEVGPLLNELAELASSSLSKKVEIGVDVPSSLPPVSGDPTLLRQVFMNLIINAVEAVGESVGTVQIRAGTAGERVRIEVVDTGEGMEPATTQRIFDPFFTTKFTGRGLGLSAVQGIVKSHGGKIVVESVPGEGSRFEVHLPAAVRAAPIPEPTLVQPSTGTQSATVLVVDDEALVRDIIVAVLTMDGFDCVTARDGEEAVAIVQDRADELAAVVMDLTMPTMGGGEAMAMMREVRADLPVLLLSGFAPDAVAAFAPDGFLRKPFAAEALQVAVADLIRDTAP